MKYDINCFLLHAISIVPACKYYTTYNYCILLTCFLYSIYIHWLVYACPGSKTTWSSAGKTTKSATTSCWIAKSLLARSKCRVCLILSMHSTACMLKHMHTPCNTCSTQHLQGGQENLGWLDDWLHPQRCSAEQSDRPCQARNMCL